MVHFYNRKNSESSIMVFETPALKLFVKGDAGSGSLPRIHDVEFILSPAVR